jgi:hypothetical protein
MTTDPEVTVRGFKKCCIYAEMEDKEKVGNVGSECERDGKCEENESETEMLNRA